MTTIADDTTIIAELPAPSPKLPSVRGIASRGGSCPFLFLLYVIAFLDRMNVGAAALQMPHDLGFSEGVIGMGAGVFFLGYFLLEIPGALIVERWSARRWIARIMISWGLVTVLMAFIHTSGSSMSSASWLVLRKPGFCRASSSTLRIGSGIKTGPKPSHFSTRRILFPM